MQCETRCCHEKKKKRKTILFMTVQYSTLFYELPRTLLPGITKSCGVHLRFAILGIIYSLHENTNFSLKINGEVLINK